jgi:hypothetical protein
MEAVPPSEKSVDDSHMALQPVHLGTATSNLREEMWPHDYVYISSADCDECTETNRRFC